MEIDGKIITKEEIIKQRKEMIKKNPEFAKNIEALFPEDKVIEEVLKNPNLFDILIKEIDKKVVGEDDSKKTLLLILLGGKLTKNAEPTSTNVMVNDLSGAGKDYSVKSIIELLPKKDVTKTKRISEKIFTYLHNAKFEPEWTWNGKIFYNEDISNNILNSDVFKVMSSSDGENKSYVVINQSPIEVITKGKPVMVITIASANPKQELLRRFPIMDLDTSEEQTKAILKRKAMLHEKGIKPSYSEEIKNSIKLLKRVKVKVPYASKLIEVLSTKNIIIRTHFDRFIDYIKFSCAIHQFQRETDEEGFLITNEQDYSFGRIALLKTTSNIFSIPLTKNQKRILEVLSELERKPYSVNDLEPLISFIGERQLRRELDKLDNFGFLEKSKEDRETSKQSVMVYRYLDLFKIKIPEWKDIQNKSKVSLKTIKSNKSKESKEGTIDTFDTFDYKIQGQEEAIFDESK